MGKKAKKSKGKNAYIVDDVDTTSLNLKQLQTFCERVYQDIKRTELESRSLELERNKLKIMVEISTQELITSKANRRQKEFELGQTNESIVFDALELQKQIRNVKNEKCKEIMQCMSVVDNNLQIAQRDSDECRANIEHDITNLQTKIVQQDKDKNVKITALMQQLEQEKSKLLSTHDNDSKLQTARYEKQMAEMSLKLKKKNMQEMQGFNEYKIRKINEFLNEKDKLNVSLRHYYEKLQQRNMNVLDGMHERYKLVKDDVKKLQSTLKIHKEAAIKNCHEIETNKGKIRELSNKLANLKSDQKELKDTKLKLITGQKMLSNKQWDNLFLEEALVMMNKEAKKLFEGKEKDISNLKKRVTSEMVRLECWAKKIITHLNKMNHIIESHENKDNKNLRMSLIREIVFAQLEDEAKQEEKRKSTNEFSFHPSTNRHKEL